MAPSFAVAGSTGMWARPIMVERSRLPWPPSAREAANLNAPARSPYLSFLKLGAMIALLLGVAFLVHLGWS